MIIIKLSVYIFCVKHLLIANLVIVVSECSEVCQVHKTDDKNGIRVPSQRVAITVERFGDLRE